MVKTFESLVAKADAVAIYMKHTLPKVVKNKIDGDDKLVVSLVLIAVAVMLCWVFRDAITFLFVGNTNGGSATSTSLIGNLTQNIQSLFNKTGTNTSTFK